MKRATILIWLVALSLLCAILASAQAPKPLKLSPGQSVYIVALDTSSRRSDITGADLEIERKAKEQFAKERKFKLASVLKDADFVFLVAVDRDARDYDEIAIALSPSDYQANSSSLEQLRNAALWQASGHYRRGRNVGLAAATVGYSGFFHHPSVVKGLVRQFHKEVLSERARRPSH